MTFKLIMVLVFALVVALFAIQNAQAVAIHFLNLSIPEVPLAAIMLGMLSIGVLLAVLVSAPGALGKARKIRELENELKRRDELLAKQEQSIKEFEKKAQIQSTEAVK